MFALCVGVLVCKHVVAAVCAYAVARLGATAPEQTLFKNMVRQNNMHLTTRRRSGVWIEDFVLDGLPTARAGSSRGDRGGRPRLGQACHGGDARREAS